jgi:uncharacterized protein YacL
MRKAIQIIFILFLTLLGGIAGYLTDGMSFMLIGAGIGVLSGLFLLFVEYLMTERSGREIAAGIFGVILGLLVGNATAIALTLIPQLSQFQIFLFIFSNLIFIYLGILFMMRFFARKKGNLLQGNKSSSDATDKILDTSAIIDGRIADISECHFIEGNLILPQFVIRELQYIADSPDPLRRARGRRGLDILKRLQDSNEVEVVIDDREINEGTDVDAKLVRLAEIMKAKIVTNDYNLNKVCDLHGVIVLNINELAKGLRPVFLPGEELNLRLVKRGKEMGQGVGYLEDGTMVVVDDGATKLGRTVICVVTSVLQTTAGRMIFSKLKEGQ